MRATTRTLLSGGLWLCLCAQTHDAHRPSAEKISCPAPPTREPRDLLGAPAFQWRARSMQHVLGGVTAHRADLEACRRRFLRDVSAAAAEKPMVTLHLTIDANGTTRDVSAATMHSPELAACLVDSAVRWRFPPACGELTFDMPLPAGFLAAPRVVEVPRPDFWEWSAFEVPSEQLLAERADTAQRLLSNLRLGQVREWLALGENAFGLQKYARTRSVGALRERQRQTLAGFSEFLRDAPGHAQTELALLGLIVTLCELDRASEAERLYQRLLARAPSPSTPFAAWAHLTLAEQAARQGKRALADQRYARVLAALPAEDRVYAYAYARRLQNKQ